MAKQTRDPNREKYWRDLIRRREASGLTVGAFCKKEGVTPSGYNHWRQEIRRRDQERATRKRKPADPKQPTLIPVNLIEDHAPSMVEVVVQNGLVVRVPEGVSTDHVRRVLHLIHELS